MNLSFFNRRNLFERFNYLKGKIPSLDSSRRYLSEQFLHWKKKISSVDLPQIKSELIRIFKSQKKIIGFSAAVSFCLVLLIAWALRVRSNFIAASEIYDKKDFEEQIATPGADFLLKDLSGLDLNILGASDSAVDTDDSHLYNYTYPTSVPIQNITFAPIPTFSPYPTLVPYSTVAPTSAPDCSGTPTAYNSEAIVSASSSQVNHPVTIEIQLLDCHNDFAPVSDDLKVALANSDGTARINSLNSPIYIKAQNGKATVSVNSQINITDTFVITNTTRGFNVTDPHNHNPSITFINNTSGNPNCTTAPGVPNFWYSDVYPASPLSSTVGTAVTFNVVIRDCDQNTVSSNESLNISLANGDGSTTVNGHGLPYSLTAASGQVNLSVNSQNAGTVTIVVRDTSHSFNITDPNNHNPSVNFTSSPASAPEPTSTPTAPTPTQIPAPTPTTQVSPTATTNPVPTVDTTLHPLPS